MQRTDSSQNLLQLVLRTRDHAAFYSPSSHSLSLQPRVPSSQAVVRSPLSLPPHSTQQPSLNHHPNQNLTEDQLSYDACPTCLRPWSPYNDAASSGRDQFGEHDGFDPFQASATSPNYFRLLAEGATFDESGSFTRSGTPDIGDDGGAGNSSVSSQTGGFMQASLSASSASTAHRNPQPLDSSASAPGYYARFFVELKKLGRGSKGQVYLCQHVLNGNRLGTYAVKKIPCGDDAEHLLTSLKEVHLLETLQHPNVIHYQHAWIEDARTSVFAPVVPTLHVLMMAANGGSLADWIYARAGRRNDSPAGSGTSTPCTPNGTPAPMPERARAEKLKAAFRRRKAAAVATVGRQEGMEPRGGGAQENIPAVHLLREDEIVSLMRDIAAGLGFLHSRGVLHLDVKPGNCLLHWDDDALIPRVLLTDFGSSAMLHENWLRTRSGHTGTMEFMAPESLQIDPRTGVLQELSSKADMWSLGMILHLLLFFRLPYSQVDDIDILRREMLAYQGMRGDFPHAPGVISSDSVLLPLLHDLLQLDPQRRPSCEEVLMRLGVDDTQHPHKTSSKASYSRRRGSSRADTTSASASRAATAAGKDGWQTSSLADSHPLIRRQLSLSAPDSLPWSSSIAAPNTWAGIRAFWEQHRAIALSVVWALLQVLLMEWKCGPYARPHRFINLLSLAVGIGQCIFAANSSQAGHLRHAFSVPLALFFAFSAFIFLPSRHSLCA